MPYFHGNIIETYYGRRAWTSIVSSAPKIRPRERKLAESSGNRPRAYARHGPLIAVVDDDERVLESLDDLLQSSGYRTFLSTSVERFLDSPARSTVDALISDIALPGMSGIELLRTLLRDSQHPPAILIAGRNEARFEEAARDLGVLRLFVKPFDTDELLAMLERQFASKGL
jgi:FixJ family two-component response regulator